MWEVGRMVKSTDSGMSVKTVEAIGSSREDRSGLSGRLEMSQASPRCPRCQLDMRKVKFRLRRRAGFDCRPQMLAVCPTCGASVDYATLFRHTMADLQDHLVAHAAAAF